MLYTLKMNGKKYAYDSASGAVLSLNTLQMKMLGVVTQDVIYSGECSMCTCEEGVFFFIWMEYPEDTNEC